MAVPKKLQLDTKLLKSTFMCFPQHIVFQKIKGILLFHGLGALRLFLHCIIHATYSEIWRFPKETGKIDKLNTFYKKYHIIPELKSKYIKGSRGLMGAISTKGSSTTKTSISKTEA